MPRASPIQTNFNAGQFSRLLEGRVDIAQYANACYRLTNMLPTIQGPAFRRGGTRHIKAARDETARPVLVDFEPRGDLAYILEFGNLYIRFFSNRGVVIVTGAPAYNAGTTYAVDDYVTSSGLTYRSRVAGNVGNTPASSPTQWEQTDHLIVTTPYAGADVAAIRWVQSLDVLYLVHPSYPPQKLLRTGPAEFALEAIEFEGGPFLEQNTDESVTVEASAATGTVTLTASASIFTAAMVGSLVELESQDLSVANQWVTNVSVTSGNLRRNDGKVYEATNTDTTGPSQPIHTSGDASDGEVTWRYRHDLIGVARITAFTSGTEVTAVVQKRIPNDVVSANTWRWSLGAWSGAEGYPSYAAFFRERLCFAKDDVIDMSVSQDFENFTAREFGEVLPTNAIRIRVVADELPQIRWLSPQDQLLVGTISAEFAVAEESQQNPLGPDNVKAARQTKHGVAAINPVQIGEATLFVQRQGRKLRELAFRLEVDRYVSPDMTVFAEDITETGIVAMAYQAEPNSVLWCVRSDGVLLAFTYNREQSVTGWSLHSLGGAADASGAPAVVEAVQTIPDPNGGRDDVWLVVRRTIDGATRRYIEVLERAFNPSFDVQEDCFYVDSGLSYDVPLAVSAITATDPVVVTVTGHGLSDGDLVSIRGIRWVPVGGGQPEQLNGRKYRVANVATDTFELTTFGGADIDGTGFSAYVSGGEVRRLVTTISGLGHLEGETVSVLVDGATHPDREVASGSITLQSPAGTVHVGLPYVSDLHTMRIEAGAAAGTAQTKIKRFSKCAVRVDNTLGLKFGPDAGRLDVLPFRAPPDAMDRPPPLVTGDLIFSWNSGFERDGRILLRQDQPLPFMIVAIVPDVNTQG